jgi:stromal membrane-associated protein
MSNRSILADEKLQAEFRQTLEDLVKNIPDNRTCADCGVKGPRWTSTNLGVFICTRCAGIHRSLGTHISKVKSIDLDNWTPEHVETLKRIGNALAKQVFEHAIPGSYRRPATSGHVGTETLEIWIRDKYEHKSFTDKQAYHQVYVLGANSTGRQTTTTHAQSHTQHASHGHTTQSHAQHPSHHPQSQPHHPQHHGHTHQSQHTQHRSQQQQKSELLLDFGTTTATTAPITAAPNNTAVHNSNNRGKDFLDTIEFSQFQTATAARPNTTPQFNGTQPTAAQPKQSTAQNMQDTKSILMQLYNNTPNTPNTGFGAQNTSGQTMGGQTMMMMPGQPMMLAPGGVMSPQTPGMVMMNPGQSGVSQGMMMHQGQPVMMTQQGQMMMAPNQPIMYGNQFYYPAQGSMQYPAQSHVTGQYAQNTGSTQFQQPSQFR